MEWVIFVNILIFYLEMLEYYDVIDILKLVDDFNYSYLFVFFLIIRLLIIVDY